LPLREPIIDYSVMELIPQQNGNGLFNEIKPIDIKKSIV